MPNVLALAAHPDDIEFVFAGTLLRLADAGWQIHYANLCDGSKGSMDMDAERCARIRLTEARRAAAELGATFYPPLVPDLELEYTSALVRRVASYVRRATPRIVLTHSPIDYMEDHQTACRLATTATFARAMPNLNADPPHPPTPPGETVTLYHAQPYGNRTPLGEPVVPTHFVDTADVIDRQTSLLELHDSQREWLDRTQGLGSYLQSMRSLAAEVGRMSGRYAYAEGWRRHHHLGFCGPDDDPLVEALEAPLIFRRRDGG